MNNNLQAYAKVNKTTMSGRDIEAEVLTQAALKMRDCQESWGAANREERLNEALKYNQMIWSVFQGELINEENPLPDAIKQDMLSLSAFIDKRIFEVMAYPAPEKLTILININNNIAAGLRAAAKNINPPPADLRHENVSHAV